MPPKQEKESALSSGVIYSPLHKGVGVKTYPQSMKCLCQTYMVIQSFTFQNITLAIWTILVLFETQKTKFAIRVKNSIYDFRKKPGPSLIQPPNVMERY